MNRRLSLSTCLGYAVPAFSLAVIGIPVYVYIPKFYTDVVGVPIATAGTVLLAIRLFDAITDPLIGFMSDRTKSRLGRRRPYLVFGVIPLAVSLFMLFAPPVDLPVSGALWFGTALFLLFLFWTVVSVPYEALGPELTYDYDERTVLMGWRDGFLLLGTLAAAVSPAIIARLFHLDSDEAGQRTRNLYFALLYGPLLLTSCWICAAVLRERAQVRDREKLSELLTLLRNKPFMILLASYMIAAFGSNLPATLILYYVEYVIGSTRADLFLLLYFLTGILCLPLWVVASKRIGKKKAWIGAMLINTGAFAGVYFLGQGHELAYGVLVVLSGTGFGASIVLPAAMQADVIDYDEYLTGQRREGIYVGTWSVVKKLAAAFGVGIGLSLLGRAGYQPGVTQPPGIVRMLRILYALVPSLCSVAGIVVVLAYPITRERHTRILSALEHKGNSESQPDPLA